MRKRHKNQGHTPRFVELDSDTLRRLEVIGGGRIGIPPGYPVVDPTPDDPTTGSGG